MSAQLAGQVAVVTGASKGIGAAIAQHLAAAGAAVVVNYSSSKAGAEKVVAQITRGGGKAVAVQANVARPEDISRLFAEAKKAFGKLDILVNNAGIYEFSPLENVTAEHFHKQFDLNVLGLLLTTQEAVKHFGPAGGLHGQAVRHRRDVAGQIGRVGVGWQVPFGNRSLEAATQGSHARGPPASHIAPNRIRRISADQGPLHQQASRGILWVGRHFDGAIPQALHDGPGGGLAQSRDHVARGTGGVAIERLAEQGFLVPKGRVETGAINSHRPGQIGQRGSLVTLVPEDT